MNGPDVTIVAEPEKILRGAVKEADTGKGRRGVLVLLTRRDSGDLLRLVVEARTDAEGRFEIRGARKSKRYMLEVAADGTAGYLPCQVWADDTPGYQPIAADIAVKKGVLVTGKMIDGSTGKPLRGHVMIAALAGNRFLKDFPRFDSSAWLPLQPTGSDGTFRLVAIPGPMLLMGGPSDGEPGRFQNVEPDPKYPKYFMRQGDSVAFYHPDSSISLVQGNFCKVLQIEPDAKVIEQDIVLKRASVRMVSIKDADGKPLRGVFVGGSSPQRRYSAIPCGEADCPVYAIEARLPRLLVFFHAGRKLGGSLMLQGDEKSPVAVKLSPAASIKGRLLDADGKPLAGVAVDVRYRQRAATEVYNSIHGNGFKQVVTDADGVFSFDDVIPQQKFELSFRRGTRKFQRAAKPADPAIQIEPGERRDLGAIKITRVPD